LKYMNAGLMILFLNYRLRINATTKLGNYDDLTPSWYTTIGYSVTLTLFLKIFSIVFWALLGCCTSCTNKCLDTGCTCDMRRTKKRTLKEYINLYTGYDFNIDFSYTEIINTIYVSFTFGPVLPIIYYVAILHLLTVLFRDKIQRN